MAALASATKTFNRLRTTDESGVQRRLSLLALSGGLAQSLCDDECFGNQGVRLTDFRKELSACGEDRVAKLFGASKRRAISAYSPPRLGLPHAFE